jgi:CheY-like chemotaxis protein
MLRKVELSEPPATSLVSPLVETFSCGTGQRVAQPTSATRKRSLMGCKRPFILIADDEPLIASTLTEILTSEGYDAISVGDGLNAIECAQRLAPDILLVDVAMPGINGIETAKRIKLISPATRVICFSGHQGAHELLAKATGEGHRFEFLSKPIKPHALVQTIQAGSA